MGNQNSFESVSSYDKRSLNMNIDVKSSGESSKRRLVIQMSSQEATIHGSSCVYTNQTTEKLERKNKNNPIEKQPATDRKKESAEGTEVSLHNRVMEQTAKTKRESGNGPERLSNKEIEKQLAKMKRASGKWSERLSNKLVEKQPAERTRERGKLLEISSYDHIEVQPAKKKRVQPAKKKRKSGKLLERSSYNHIEEQPAKKKRVQPAKKKRESEKLLERSSYNHIEVQPAKKKRVQPAKKKRESGKLLERSAYNQIEVQPAKKRKSGKLLERSSYNHIEVQPAKKRKSGKLLERSSYNHIEVQPAKKKKESGKLLERSSYNHIEVQPAKEKRESGKFTERLSHKPIKEQPAKMKSESGRLLERLSYKPFKEQLAKGKGDNAKRPERLSFCQICMDKKTEVDMFNSRNCSHSYCLVCTGKHVAAKLRENIIKVKCPDLACSGLLEPQDFRSVVPQQELDRWEAKLCESVLGSQKIYCPFRDCSAPLVDDGKQVVTSAECPHCHRLFCAQCKIPWHANSKCKPKGESMDKKFIELAEKEKWQKCPSCKFYVQKTQGCESIKCRCGNNFCYVCGKGWAFGHLCATGRRI